MSRPRETRFIYFDLGNVLLYFDPRVACRRMAEVAGVSPDLVHEVVYLSHVQRAYENGLVSSQEFYNTFCTRTGTQPSLEQFLYAHGDMFEENVEAFELVKRLRQQGWRLGILSNTCESHWVYCMKHYADRFLLFEVYALSFQLRIMKPDPKIYATAAQLAGVQPHEIFFVDDRTENVAAALQAGFDAVQFQGTRDLAEQLSRRGILVPDR